MLNFRTRVKNAFRCLTGDIVLDPSSVASLDAYFRDGTVDESINSSKRISTVYSCVRIISDAIASLPLKLIIENESGDKQPATSNPLYWVLSTQPCPWLDSFAYWKFNINCLLLRGVFVSHVIRNNTGKIMRLVPVNPADIDVAGIKLDRAGQLLFPITTDGVLKVYPASDLFFAYYETLDGVKPVSPIKFACETFKLARNAQKYGNDTLQKGAVPPGYYTTEQKVGSESYTRLKDQLSQNNLGDNRGKAPLLDQGLKYNTVSMTAEDMQMLGTRRYEKEEICGIFGVPPHLIGDTAQAKGWSTMEQTMTEFLQLSLTPFLVRIEKAITTRLIPESQWGTSYAKFSVSGLLRGDVTARTNFYRTMSSIGAMSANDVRKLEDMNAVPGGEIYRVQVNTAPATQGEQNVQP